MRWSLLMAVVLGLAALPAEGADPAPARVRQADTGEQPAADDLIKEVRRNRRLLLRAHTSAPPASERAAALEEAVRKLREAARRPVARPEPFEAPPPDAAEAEAAVPTSVPAPKRPTLSAAQLRLIRELPLKDLGDPMALADSLFLGGHLAEACTLYERLLEEASLSKNDQAWCLFQAAGCKRPTDPSGALTLYERLLTQYPDSPWTDAAKARQAILQWQKQARPRALLGIATPFDANATPEGNRP